MAFTSTSGTARGRCRLLISDTDTADATKQIFTDAEIDDFLAIENNEVYAAAAAACQSLEANTVRSATRMTPERWPEIARKHVPKHCR